MQKVQIFEICIEIYHFLLYFSFSVVYIHFKYLNQYVDGYNFIYTVSPKYVLMIAEICLTI